MAGKTLNLVLALAGILAIACIVLLGYDVYRAARTGPRWKRRLVAAGLALLSAFGLPACGEKTNAGPPAVVGGGNPATTLDEAPRWKRLTDTWRQAEDVASGKLGPYPFDEAGKKALLAALATAGNDVDALRAEGLLSEAETGLLKLDLAELNRGVQAKRPTEMRMATCYKPMMLRPVHDSMKRLSDRLPLLEKLAADATVQPHVVAKVIATVQRDIATLGDEKLTAVVPEPDRVKAEGIRKAAAALVAKLKAAMGE